MKISVSRPRPLDIQAQARIWRADSGGTMRRMGNSALPLAATAETVNSLLALHPRPVFHQCQSLDDLETTGIDPLYLYEYLDGITNARDFRVVLIAVPRLTTTNRGYAMRYGDSTHRSAEFETYASARDLCNEVFECSYSVDRGAAAAADVQEGVSTIEGFTIVSATIQDEPLSYLDTTVHGYVVPTEARQGAKVIEGLPQDIWARQTELFSYHLPIVLSWSARGCTLTPSAPGDWTGITITSETYVNVLDQSVTSRSTTSPGWFCDRYAAAMGLKEGVKCTPRVLAVASGADGTVKFEGPWLASPGDYCEVTVPAGGAAGWYGVDADYWYLDSTQEWDEASARMNKTDVFGKVGAGGSMTIYGLRGWQLYEI